MSVIFCQPLSRQYKYQETVIIYETEHGKEFELEHEPRSGILQVCLNGLENNTENDYELTGKTVRFYDDVILTAGDIISFKYYY